MGRFPIFLELSGRRVVVIGGGNVAARKAEALLSAGARIVVISTKISDELKLICSKGGAELIESKYSKDYLGGAVLVIAATNDHEVNSRVYKDCQQLEILCNVVDAPELCDFYVPAIVTFKDLQIAIGTEGQCPAYAGHLRKKLEEFLSEKHGEFLDELGKARKRVIENVGDANHRKSLMGRLVSDDSFEYFKQHNPDEWQSYADRIIAGIED